MGDNTQFPFLQNNGTKRSVRVSDGDGAALRSRSLQEPGEKKLKKFQQGKEENNENG